MQEGPRGARAEHVRSVGAEAATAELKTSLAAR